MKSRPKKKMRLLSGLLSVALCVPMLGSLSAFAAERTDANMIDVTEYGADKTGASDSAEAIIAAIAAAKERSDNGKNAVTIRFPNGRYDIYPDKAEQRELYISNTVGASQQYNMKTIGMLFEDMKNITVEGDGSLIMLHGEMTSIVTIDCENVTFQNFKLDVATPTAIDVTVEKVEGNTATIFVPDCFDYEIVGNAVHWKSDKSPYTGEVYWTKYNTTTHPNDTQDYLTRIQEHNPETGMTLRVDKTVSPFANVASVTSDGANRLTVTYTSTPVVHAGSTYQMRDGLRAQCGTFFWKSKDIAMKHVDIYYLHGFGILGQTTENVTLYDVQFDAPKGTGRMTTAFADCVQMSGCKGKIDIQNCGFNNSHDDPINVHGTYLQVKEISEDRKQITVRYMHGGSTGFPTFFTGDQVQFVLKTTMATVADYTGTVTAVAGPTGNSNVSASGDMNTTVITLDTPIPAEVAVDTHVVEDITWIPEVYVAGCVFKEISSRGVLSTVRKITIENNLFDRIGMAAINISCDATQWYESGKTEDVTIRNNVFRGCKMQSIQVNPTNTGLTTSSPSVHKQLLIESNRFYMEEEPIESSNTFYASNKLRILEIRSVDHIIFQNNKIFRTSPAEGTLLYLFEIIGARHMTVANNGYEAGLNASAKTRLGACWNMADTNVCKLTNDQMKIYRIGQYDTPTATITTDSLGRVGSTDATLVAPTIQGADFGVFDAATTGYVALAKADTISYSFAPAFEGATVAVTLNGISTAASVTNAAVVPGQNVIEITVTAADGITQKYYSFTVLDCASTVVEADTSWYSEDKSEQILTDAADLLGFSQLLASGTTFNGKTVKLAADIDLNPAWQASATAPVHRWSNVAGRSFEGTFDGQGHTIRGIYLATDSEQTAIFACVQSGKTAAVKNLVIQNSYISSSKSTMGGLFGKVQGNATIENVYLDLDMNLTYSTTTETAHLGGLVGYVGAGNLTVKATAVASDLTATAGWVRPVGGFIGRVDTNSTVTFENSGFFGTVRTGGNQVSAGIGRIWGSGITVTYRNCIMTGQAFGSNGMSDANWIGSFAAGCSGSPSLTIEHSIYTKTAYASNTWVDQPVGQTDTGASVTKTDIKCVSNDALAGWKGYVAKLDIDARGMRDWVAVNNSFPLPSKVADALTVDRLNGNLTGYQDSASEFVLTDAADLLGFSGLLAMGKNFKDKTVKLAADIDLNPDWTASAEKPENCWLPAYGKSFAGTFDGQGHTIRGLYLSANSNDVGVFACVNSGLTATLKNFSIQNSYLTTTGRTVGGLFGFVVGKATVENVYLDIDMHTTYSETTENTEMGGLVGRVYQGNLTVKNTAVASDLTATAGWVRPVGGFAGKVDGANAVANFENCAFIGTIRTNGNSVSAGIGRIQSDSVSVSFRSCVMVGQVFGSNGMSDANWIGSFTAGIINNSTLEIKDSIYTQTAYALYTWVDQPFGTKGDGAVARTINVKCIDRDALASWNGKLAYNDLTDLGITGWTALYGEVPLPDSVAKYSKAYGVAFPSEHTCDHSTSARCPECGKLAPLQFYGWSLTLQKDLSLNYAVEAKYFADGCYTAPSVTFTVGDRTVTVNTYNTETYEGYYIFTLTDLAPYQMGETVRAVLSASDGENTVTTDASNYSIKTYCYNKLNDETASDGLKKLVVDLLNYGAATQAYVGSTDTPVNADLTEEQKKLGTTSDPSLSSVANARYQTIENASAAWEGAYLTLADAVEMKFVFKTKNVDGLTVKVTTKDPADVQAVGDTWMLRNVESAGNGTYVACFDGFHAAQMSEVVYVTVCDAEGTAVSNTYRYSIESYACAKSSDADGSLAVLVKAMMNYGNSAKSFQS